MSTSRMKVYEYQRIRNGKTYTNIIKRELKGFVKAETINKFIDEHHDEIMKFEPKHRSTYVVDSLLREQNYRITSPTALKYLRLHNMGSERIHTERSPSKTSDLNITQ